MSKLDEMYNWNGNYKLKKELKITRYKISDLKYPEYLYLFVKIDDNGDKYIKYSVFDDNFGYPALCNVHKGDYSKKVRAKVVDILNELELNGYIEKY